MKVFFSIITLFLFSFNIVKSEETLYAIKTVSNFYMNPSIDAPVIYPIDVGKRMILISKKDGWLNLLDEQTGLVGWSSEENFSGDKPKKILILENIKFNSLFFTTLKLKTLRKQSIFLPQKKEK